MGQGTVSGVLWFIAFVLLYLYTLGIFDNTLQTLEEVLAFQLSYTDEDEYLTNSFSTGAPSPAVVMSPPAPRQENDNHQNNNDSVERVEDDNSNDRNAKLARWFAIGSKLAGDSQPTDCHGATAAEWRDGCTFGKRGRWYAGEA